MSLSGVTELGWDQQSRRRVMTSDTTSTGESGDQQWWSCSLAHEGRVDTDVCLDCLGDPKIGEIRDDLPEDMKVITWEAPFCCCEE